MKKGVIYARYSSDRQNEQSITGQVDVCTKWADNNDIEIVEIYVDEALTGKTDRRPDFQRMVMDAKDGRFDFVIVYKFDRFARNRTDSAIYKAQLKKYGVKVLSAMEKITDGPEGILLESLLEGMAEFYSANLAQNVERGMRQKAELGKFMGGTVPLGYIIDEEKNYVVDEKSAPAVKIAFEMYADGHNIKEICEVLNASGYRTATKKEFNYNSLHSTLRNKKYTGLYEFFDIVLYDAIPRLVDDATFDKVQERLEKNKRSPARSKGEVDYYLTGKLFCGKCGSNMVGDSGTGKSGNTYYYYSCIEKKRKHGCTKKSVKKHWIEQLVTDFTIQNVLTPENIEYLAQKAYELYETERTDDSELISLKAMLRDTQKAIDNIMDAIEQGIITSTTKQRLLDAEERKKATQLAIAKAEIKKPKITKEHIEFFLYEMKNKIYNAEEQIEVIVNTFVNAVYLYDDKLIITFNLKEGEKIKKLELTELSEMTEGGVFGFYDSRVTIAILSEHKMFAVVLRIRSS